jgi:DNA (cytosine-5)-methyltransferase 1
MTHLDLFSGIGGFSLGLKRVFNIEHTYFSEIDKYAIDVFKHNFKNSTYVKSVTDVRGAELPRIDIITFGSPCQDFSLAGKREGLGGERSGLITEAIRIIKECRPRFFIWENVKGTFSSNSGADFWAIIQTFTNIGGYRLEWQLLNTKWFLPQNRERIYLVGCLGKGSGRQIFPITANNRQINDIQRPETNGQPVIKIKTNNKKGYEIAVEGDTINYQNLKSTTRRGRVGKQIAQTLDSGGEQAVIGYSRDAKGKVTNYHTKDIANTLHSSSGGGGNTDQYILNKSIRRLTPIECERLQGFPDNWTRHGQELGEISDSQRYKMCGNAVTVDVVEAVAKKIKESL